MDCQHCERPLDKHDHRYCEAARALWSLRRGNDGREGRRVRRERVKHVRTWIDQEAKRKQAGESN